ncbi:MAG: hypothetical protein JHC84_05335 [Solirubrobacteraceae bacterium]|nr:hypothetical protein [Solirubrobacteraceae bacterium]
MATPAAAATPQPEELPADNAARLAIFDALFSPSEPDSDTPPSAVTENELFDRVIGRLRVLVPRELHLAGEREYLREKLLACADAGLLSLGSFEGESIVALTGVLPSIRYPDGVVREYTPGLEAARERLDRDNTRLRAAQFDARALIPSCSDNPESPEFQALLASMREHGFLRQFWVAEQEDGVVVDGRARVKAAAILGINVERVKYTTDRDESFAQRRDTPLNRVMLAIQANYSRLRPETITEVHNAVAQITDRPWEETADDLTLTSEWRRAKPPKYKAQFEVKKVPFRSGEPSKVQVTPDRKVMVRSLVEAGGLSNYKVGNLAPYVTFEKARSAHSSGQPAIFAQASDLISGIAAMQREREAAKRKFEPEWDAIRAWLIKTYGADEGSATAG